MVKAYTLAFIAAAAGAPVAATPFNDLFENAFELPAGPGSLAGSSEQATSVYTGSSALEPGFGLNGATNGVWFTFGGTGSVVDVDTDGSLFDTVLFAFSDAKGAYPFSFSDSIAANDDAVGLSSRSKVSFETDVGSQYWILLGGFGESTGDYTVSWSDAAPVNSTVIPLPASGVLLLGAIGAIAACRHRRPKS